MVFWELIAGVGIPSIGAVAFIIRYFWNKEKCFLALKNKINSLDQRDKISIDEHDGFAGRIKVLENDATEIKIYLRLLLDNAGIKYNQ